MLKKYFIVIAFVLFLLGGKLQAQITMDTTMTPLELVQNVLLGSGVSISNVTFNGMDPTILNPQAGRMFGTSNFVEFPEAVVLISGHTFQVEDDAFPQLNPDPNVTNDPDLQQISGINSINNCSILEFDFVPNGDSLIFRYVFASTEYPGFTCSSFNDAFGFFLSGPGIAGPFTDGAINIALIPNSDTPVAVNTVNSGMASNPGNEGNCESANPDWIEDSQYFVSNDPQEEGDVQFPGMTQTFIAYAEVECGEEYHIKLAIGDASDGALDSGVFLEAGSFQSNSVVNVELDIPVGVNDSTLYEGCGEATLQFIRPNDSQGVDETAYLNISGTAQNGVDFIPALPDSVFFPAGVDTVTFVLSAPFDGNFEGVEYATVEITNIASNCSGAVITTDFTFYINEADPLGVIGFNGALADCNDEIELYPTVTGGFGEYSYSWSNGSNEDTVTVSPGFTTTYFVVIGDTCGVPDVQTSFEVDVPTYPPVMVDLGEDFVVEECDVTVDIIPVVSGGFGLYTYSWQEEGVEIGNTPTLEYEVQTSTTIQLVITDDCGAFGIDDVLITVPEQTVTAFLPDIFEAESCLDDIMLPAISEGGIGQKTYSWFVDGELRVTTPAPFFMYNPSMGQEVVIVAEDECQNFGVDSTIVSFNFPQVEIDVFPSDTSVCLEVPVQLKVEVLNGSGNYKPSWENSDSTYTYTVFPSGNSSYSVVVEDTCGMRAEKSVEILVQDPRADFDYEYFGFYGIHFSNYSRATEPSTYLWDFGDGSFSDEKDPSHEFAIIDPYEVILTVTDNIGCTDSIGLITIPPAELYIPTSFTPNGDGINDLFGVEGANIVDFEMWIFDRWGKQVFHSVDPDKKWNGSHQGGDHHNQTSTYNYLIRYRGIAEEDAREITGQITVIR